MAKKIIGYIKLQVPAGKANPSPPIGPALGQRGLNIMEFCKAFNAQTQEASQCLIAWINDLTQGEERRWSTCVIASSKQLRDFAQQQVKQKGLKTEIVEANQSCQVVPDTIYFSTMHRAKGLEFDQVIVLSRQELLKSESDGGRKLLYVAMTRARRESRVIFV